MRKKETEEHMKFYDEEKFSNVKKKERLFEGLQPMFKAGAVHIKKDMHEFIGELLDFPKGSHDDTIDAFWLSTQFAKGNKKVGTVKKVKKGIYGKNQKKDTIGCQVHALDFVNKLYLYYLL